MKKLLRGIRYRKSTNFDSDPIEGVATNWDELCKRSGKSSKLPVTGY